MRYGFSPLTADLEYPEAFDLASELGLFLEIAYDLHEINPRLPTAKDLLEMGRAAGVGFTVHLPFVDLNLASLVPEVSKLSIERIQRSMEFSHQVGAYCGVLHTGTVPLRQDVAVQVARNRLAKALEALLPLPIPVALENLVLEYTDLLQGPAELAEVLRAHRAYGFCLDVGHALIERGAEGSQEYYGLLSNRLIHYHLHDNGGAKDDHLAAGLGKVNWTWVKSVLQGFEGTIALEVTGGAKGVRDSIRLLTQREPERRY